MKNAATIATVAVVAAGALAWAFKSQIRDAWEGKTGQLLARIEHALCMIENGLTELESREMKAVGMGVMRKMLTSCSVDLDYIYSKLDGLDVNSAAARTRRKALVERANNCAERLENLQEAYQSIQ
jgi:hypothetical protein